MHDYLTDWFLVKTKKKMFFEFIFSCFASLEIFIAEILDYQLWFVLVIPDCARTRNHRKALKHFQILQLMENFVDRNFINDLFNFCSVFFSYRLTSRCQVVKWFLMWVSFQYLNRSQSEISVYRNWITVATCKHLWKNNFTFYYVVHCINCSFYNWLG